MYCSSLVESLPFLKVAVKFLAVLYLQIQIQEDFFNKFQKKPKLQSMTKAWQVHNNNNNNNRSIIFIWGFYMKDDILAFVLKLEISCRVLISWRILVSFKRIFFEDYIFCMVKYLSFYNSSSFALRYFLINANGKAREWHTPLFFLFLFLLWCLTT